MVIGDPLIADVSLQPGGLAVITGKGYGATNVVVLDKTGAVLMERNVEVKGPPDPDRLETIAAPSATPIAACRNARRASRWATISITSTRTSPQPAVEAIRRSPPAPVSGTNRRAVPCASENFSENSHGR